VTSLLQVQSDIAVMMRENEAQQQLLKELQARHHLHEFEQNFPLFHVSMHHLFITCDPLQAQKEALEAALSGEGLRQLQSEIDSLRERGKAAGGNVMYRLLVILLLIVCVKLCCFRLLEAELRRLREDATEDNRQKESLMLQVGWGGGSAAAAAAAAASGV
jgi:hypothetical protein